MKRTVYQVLSLVFGIVLILVGIGAFIGGQFAHNYVKDQLTAQAITMPTEQQIANLPTEAQDALRPFLGEQMASGTAAQAYANHYILEHMKTACTNVKDAAGNALTPVPAEKCTYAGIGSVANATDDPAAKAAYQALRASNFQGNALISMLLTAYAFWLIGTIAIAVAIAAAVVGIILVVLSMTVFKDTHRDVEATTVTVQ